MGSFKKSVEKRVRLVHYSQALELGGVHLVLPLSLLFWPAGFDERQHGNNLLITQCVLVGWHGALIGRIIDHARSAIFGDLKQKIISVMPGMPGFIVRWCGHPSFQLII